MSRRASDAVVTPPLLGRAGPHSPAPANDRGDQHDRPRPHDPHHPLVGGERREHAPRDRGAGQRDRRWRRRLGDATLGDSRGVLPTVAQHFFDAARERVAGHAAPTGNSHQRPRGRGATVSMVVGPGHRREVELADERVDARAIAMALRESARRTVDDLDRLHAAARAQLLTGGRNLVQVSGNRLDQHGRRRRNDARHLQRLLVDVAEVGGEETFIASTRVENVHMLAAEHRFDPLQDHRSLPRDGRVRRDAALRAAERPVIRDVGDVEARVAVPVAHVVVRPAFASVVRRFGVRVEIGCQHRFVGNGQRCHRPRQKRNGGVRHDDRAEESRRADDLAARVGLGARRQQPPHGVHADDPEDDRDVLRNGEQRDRVENGRERRERDVARRQLEVRFADGLERDGVADRLGGERGCHDHG